MAVRSKIIVFGVVACMLSFAMPVSALTFSVEPDPGDPSGGKTDLCSSQLAKDISAADSACTGTMKNGAPGNCSANDVTSATPFPGAVTVKCSCPSDPGAKPPADVTVRLPQTVNAYTPPFSAQNLSACGAFNTTAIICTSAGGKIFCQGKQLLFK